MHPLLNIAVKAARKAGTTISRYADRVDSVAVTSKNANDFVTEVDLLAEQDIIETIKEAYPDHEILAEESGHEGKSDVVWIIDPLDGTTNFMHGFPQYAVSIGVQVNGELDQAVIYDPFKQELFTASKGNGATVDGRKMRVTDRKTLDGALLGTGFPFKNQEILDTYLEMFKDIFSESSGVRRAGSAALDLAYVAAGRLDGFWEIGLKPWDMAAGALMIKEAGGIITDFSGKDNYLESGNVIAGNLKLHAQLEGKVYPYIQKLTAK